MVRMHFSQREQLDHSVLEFSKEVYGHTRKLRWANFQSAIAFTLSTRWQVAPWWIISNVSEDNRRSVKGDEQELRFAN